MKEKIKIYIVGGYVYSDYVNWFNCEIVEKVEDCNVIMFCGGEDVSPQLYGENQHPETYNDFARDYREVQIFERAQQLGKKIVGVCRGSQLMSVMAGGKLVQHQYNPGTHLMETFDGKKILVTSTHHQAQYPFNLPKEDYKILGWTKDMIPYHEDGNLKELNPPLECEVVYYPKINALGIQPHPEYMFNYNGDVEERFIDSIDWFREVLQMFIENKL